MSRRRSRHSPDAGSAIGALFLLGLIGFRPFWQTVTNLALPWQIATAVLILSVAFVILWFVRLLMRHARQRSLVRKELYALTPTEFEERVLLLLKDLGWSHLRLRGGSGDRGVDLEGEFQGTRYVVQCKRYHHNKSVSPSAVRDLVGALHIQKADRALLVTTSSFTPQGYAEARDQAVELWDGAILEQKISEAARLREDPTRRQAVQRRRLATFITLVVINGLSVLSAFAIAGPPSSMPPTIRTAPTPSPESVAGVTSWEEPHLLFPCLSRLLLRKNLNQQRCRHRRWRRQNAPSRPQPFSMAGTCALRRICGARCLIRCMLARSSNCSVVRQTETGSISAIRAVRLAGRTAPC
jgi:restriction system protein